MTNVSLGRLEQEVAVYSEVGPFNGNTSELVRRAVEEFLSRQTPERRMEAGLHAYRKYPITITRAAEIAGVPFDEMHQRLKVEGLIEEGIPPGMSTQRELERRRRAFAAQMKKNRKPRL